MQSSEHKSVSDGDSSDESHPFEKSAKRSGKDRVSLACHKCRSRRARCSGERPICSACSRLGYECTWPTGRRRKRTRAEMQAAAREDTLQRRNSDTFGITSAEISSRGAVAESLDIVESPSHTSSLLDYNPYADIPLITPSQPIQLNFTWPSMTTPSSFDMPLVDLDMPSTSPQFNFGLPINATYDVSQQADLLKALETQPAIIEGDPADGSFDLYYYRFSGSTAFHPGINRINLKLQSKSYFNLASPNSAPLPLGKSPDVPPSSPFMSKIRFDANGMPVEDVARPLLDLFFRTSSQFFPSIHRQRMEERMTTGTMSAFMMNCICAFSARFHPSAQSDPTSIVAPFLTKAQELLIPLLHLPTTDVITGLLLLSWVQWGMHSEAGLWTFAGLAFRMSHDLGLHEQSEIYESSAHVVRTRLLFWSLFITDRLISFSTGRPVTISEDIIEIPMPSDSDFTPSPIARHDEGYAPGGPVPFVQLVRLMVLVGRINNVLNGRRGRKRTLVAASDPSPALLSELQTQLIDLHRSLPNAMRWSVDAFKHYESSGQGGTFLMLHLWANAVLTLTYHPQLVRGSTGHDTPFQSTMQRSLKLSMSSARLINDALVFADLAASQSYTSAPLVVQPIFVAALAFIHEMRTAETGLATLAYDEDPIMGTGTDAFLASLDKQSLLTLSKALRRIEHYWAGVSYVTHILEQKQAGVFKVSPEQKHKTVAISLPDHGILRRFQAQDPLTQPATATSLRASIDAEKARNQASSSFNLEELFSQYNVLNTFISPASSYDVLQLLASTPKPLD